ncbi:MAG: lipid-A-disaccharide synthase [Candidatus Eutrophobiaceae bacterium]
MTLRRIGIVAGEQSGDLLGAGLARALGAMYPNVQLVGVGGRQMRAAGVEILYPVEELSVMGLFEVLPHLPRLLRLRRKLFETLHDRKLDAFIGIDSPDFNLPLARRLRTNGCFTVHYVSPSVWAWRRGRLAGIGRSVDLMLCLFPFEPALYAAHGIPAEFVGHPLANQLIPGDQAVARDAMGVRGAAPVVGLLPGSRRAEIKYMAPSFLQAALRLWNKYPNMQFLGSMPNEELRADFQQWQHRLAPNLPLSIHLCRSHELMQASDALICCLGTSTLEAMLLQRPVVLGYRTNALSYIVVKPLLYIQEYALPNILAGERILPEFLQSDCDAEHLSAELERLLEDSEYRHRLLTRFKSLSDSLRMDANARAATAVDMHHQKHHTQNVQ